jgi:hypothetical protein
MRVPIYAISIGQYDDEDLEMPSRYSEYIVKAYTRIILHYIRLLEAYIECPHTTNELKKNVVYHYANLMLSCKYYTADEIINDYNVKNYMNRNTF